MKKGCFVIILLILSIGFAIACGTGQVPLVKLFSENNSHVELGNQTGFNIESCVPNNTCDSTNSNAVLWLKNLTNAHVSTTQVPSYNIPACIGGGTISCTVREYSCIGNEETMFSLQNESNSHISLNNYSGYRVKICCTGMTQSTATTGTNWTDMQGGLIEEDSVVDLNDYIKMNFSGAGVPSYYEIYRDRQWPLSDDLIETTTNNYWKANISDKKFYFKVYSADDIILGVSPKIETSNSEDDTPMTFAFTSPICADDFNYSALLDGTETLQVQIDVIDEDDIARGNVSFYKDGVYKFSKTGENELLFYTLISNDITSNDLIGEVQVVGIITNTRESPKWSVSNIIIRNTTATNEKYTAACIDEPDFNEEFEISKISFNATSTIAMWYNATVIPRSYLHYNWTFLDKDTGTTISYNKTGASTNAYLFSFQFTSIGENRATLDVSFI